MGKETDDIENFLLGKDPKKEISKEQVGIVITYVGSKELAKKMISKAIEEKLSIRGQFSHVESTSWWHGEVQYLSEYKVELLCRKENASKILNLLKSLQEYALPAFIYQDVMCDADTHIWAKVV